MADYGINSVVKRKFWGSYPLKGKLLNVMNASKHSEEAVNFRRLCRNGTHVGPTAGEAAGFAQVL